VLEELRLILIETSDYALCASLFTEAFAYYQSLFPTGSSPGPDPSSPPISGGGFDTLQLLVLADLHNTLGAHEEAVHVVRAGTRWLQGRAAQRFWDACEDDREYDAEGTAGREGEPQSGCYPLDINARHRLAVARIKMGDLEEGKVGEALAESCKLTHAIRLDALIYRSRS
jgi:general transcription factor 3C polypeptide 3 (transcription factor C subunit 4)